MIIYDRNGSNILDVEVDDASFRHRAIKGDNTLTLKYSLPDHVELPRGAWCEYQFERYELLNPEAIKMHHTRNFEYTVTFEARQSRLKLWKFRNNIDGRLKFPLTATPREHLEMLVSNLNERDAGWTVGDCIETPEKLVSYDHNSCFDALGKMAQEFETEWEIADKRISLRKVEYNKANPLALAYGFGRGLKTGVGRTSSGKTPTEILFVQGGDRNIDPTKYGTKTLHLPKGQTIAYDGSKFEGEAGFVSATARRYKVDAEGLSVSRADKDLETRAEDSVSAMEIYPSRVGEVGSVVAVNTARNFYDIIDNVIPDALDYEKALIAGETMTIIFQSGQLAGREFEVKYHHKATPKKEGKRFELIPQEIDGVTMPSEQFKPKRGDKYAVFHVALPQAYIADNATKTGAEWELLKKAVRHLYENEDQKYTFTGELDGLWAKRDWTNIGGRLTLGGYISFRDDSFARDGVLLRIVGIKDFVNAPHSPILELSNDVVGSSFSGGLQKLKDDEAMVEERHKEALQFTKRRFSDAKRTTEALIEAALDGFTGKVSPIVVQTMQLLVGDESLQFRFVDNRANPKKAAHNVTFNKVTRQLIIPSGTIQHLTMGITTLSSRHAPNEYKYWDVQGFTSARLDEADKSYYIYARVEANGTIGTFRIEEQSRRIDSEAGAYWLLLGLLGAETDGERSFVAMYGFTEVLPGQIRTEKIATPDGAAYFDLNSGVIASKSIRFVYSDGSIHDYPNDYLHTAIKEGSTEVQGGLVLASILGAKDGQGNVRSFLSGDFSLPAFSAGVTGWGTPQRKATTEINHDGTGHIGNMHIEEGGSVVVFKGEEGGRDDVRIGGAQTPLKDLLSSSFQDSASTKNVQRVEFTQNSFNKEIVQVEIFRLGFNVQNDGSMIQFELPWNISVRHENSQYHKITSFATINLRITDSRDVVVYEFTEFLRSGAMQGFMPSNINYPMQADKRGLSAGLYVFSLVANVSTVIAEGSGYSGAPAVTTFTSQPFTLKYKVSGRNENVREVVFGKFGLSAFYGHKQLFYLRNSSDGEYPFVTIRGKTDMPGVLFSGDFWPSDQNGGNVWSDDSYGALFPNGIYCERAGVGQYKIKHNLGRSNYTVQVCPIYRDGYEPNNDVMARVEFKGENSFNVVTGVGNNKTNYVPFSVLIIGANYKE